MKKRLYLLSIALLTCSLTSAQVNILQQTILPHPRLLFPSKKENEVKVLIKENTLAGNIYTRLLQEANSLLSATPQKYELQDGYIKDMLGLSREQVYRMITLSLAYRLSDDSRYLKKAEEELINVCGFPNWNPRHYLDVAEMTTAASIAYDWLYAGLKESTRKAVVESIKTKALDLAIKEYAEDKPGSWIKRNTNWNVVCNTGMVMGAMAVAEDYPELAEEIVRNAVNNVPHCLRHFAPDGVCYEGPAYWGYTHNYLSVLLSVLNDNFHQDYGLSHMQGIRETALYYIHTTSPAGKIFNFANSGGTSPDTNPIYFFFSKHFNQPEVAAFYREILSNRINEKQLPRWFFFLSLPWFDNSPYSESKADPKLRVYKGINDIAVLKGDKEIPGYIYLIAKGGKPNEAHQQMDVGTFIVETDGIRWSDDLGADNYHLPGFWDYRPNGKRWDYFRNSNFSHNTLTIDHQIQYAAGTGKIVDYDDATSQPYFTIDMTSAYAEQATSVLRTITLVEDTKVIVTDRINLNSPSQEVIWNMITSADIECNGKEAKLHKDGKTFCLRILSPENAVFITKPAKTSTDKEYPVDGYQLLQVVAKGNKEMEIKISMGNKEK